MFSKLRRLNEKGLETFGLFRKDLSSLLASASSANTLGEKIQWLEDLVAWIRIPSAPDDNRVNSQIQAVRVKFFLQVLERNPVWKKAASRLLVSVLKETEAVKLLCETGLSTGDGFFSEAAERFVHRILPLPSDEKDLAELFAKVFDDESDADWLEKIDGPTLQSLLALLVETDRDRLDLFLHYRNALSEALIILSSHLESLGLSADIRLRSQVLSVRGSAFYRLRMALAEALYEHPTVPLNFAPYFVACREEINSSFAHLEDQGVSVSIVYRLEKMERYLSRLESLVAIYFATDAAGEGWRKLLADLVRSNLEGDRISTLVKHNMHMLARKIVERTGATGEHYITTSRGEYFAMLSSAAGGGLLTVGTTWVKLLIGKAGAPLFFEGFFSWLNYAGSFMLMQGLNFTLATKQPSMTAPALAAKLKDSKDSGEFAELVTRITRSQFAAALGNIGMVIPAAFATNFLYVKIFGHPLFPEEYALKTIHSLHPFKSPTLPYAALTGIILWLSSIGAGWAENWFVFRRLPETISQSTLLNRLFGKKRAERVSHWISHNVAGIGGNISLGFLLAYTPVAGRFFGLPLDVRHVTLSAGALTFSFCALPDVSGSDIALGALSIVLIGLLNFGVSFAAALYTAVKARDVKSARLGLLRRVLWEKLGSRPLEFFLPGPGKANP